MTTPFCSSFSFSHSSVSAQFLLLFYFAYFLFSHAFELLLFVLFLFCALYIYFASLAVSVDYHELLRSFDTFAKNTKLFLKIFYAKLRMILSTCAKIQLSHPYSFFHEKKLKLGSYGAQVKKCQSLIFFREKTNMDTIAENCAHLFRIIRSFT